MKRIILIIFCILITTIIVNADKEVNPEEESISKSNDMTITAIVNIYSGRMSPEWILSVDEIKGLKTKLNNLSPAKPREVPDWGYVLITNEGKSPDFPYYRIYACLAREKKDNNLITINNNGEKKYYADTNNITEWLISLGNEHDPQFKPPPTFPPNTPYMDFIQSDLFRSQATVKQNTELKMPCFTVFSEGTALLEGTISTPEFITVGTITPKFLIIKNTSFSIPSHLGESFAIEVNTSEPREIIGDIIIRSNDQNKSEVKIPIHYTIILDEGVQSSENITPDDGKLPKEPANITIDDKVIAQEPNYNKYLIAAIILITILASLLVIYHKKFR